MPTQPTCSLELITVAIAKNLLGINTSNRPKKERHINFLASQMEDDDFPITGDTIKISKSGKLLDGQHRLEAIIKSGKSQRIFVIRGLEDRVFKYIDTGRNRTGGDVLAIEGISNPDRVSAIAKFILSFNGGRFSDATSRTAGKGAKKLSNAEVSSFVKNNADSIGESMDFGYSKENNLVGRNLLTCFHFIFKSISKSEADQFCTSLATGENINKSNPIYLLREKFLIDAKAVRKMTGTERAALICKTWNYIRKKESVKILKWDNREDFPKPI